MHCRPFLHVALEDNMHVRPFLHVVLENGMHFRLFFDVVLGNAMHFMLFCMQLSTKILPPAVLREQHLIKIKELEDKLGTRIARNERLTIKEELEYTLLGKAFTQSSRIYAYINCKTGRLIIDTTSKKKLDMAYKLLHPVLSQYEPSSFELEPLGSKLTQWLSTQDHPDCFSILDKCLMTSSEEFS